MKMQITATHLTRFLEALAATLKAERDYLTQLDSAIGDADHGVNLDRGFSAVLAGLPAVADHDLGTILSMVSTTLISKVGGTSGPLYGTAFQRASRVIGATHAIGPDELVAACDAAFAGIAARGRSQRGEKTMLDTLGPALDALQSSVAAGHPLPDAAAHALAAAEDGMRATIPMLATKGRAAFLGERSIGHQDPGATSAYFLVRELVRALGE
jgi:dihydroxyacetone kinase-like protein